MTVKIPPRVGQNGSHARWTPPASAIRVADVAAHTDARSLIAGLSSALQRADQAPPAAAKAPAADTPASAGSPDDLRGFVRRFVRQEDEFHFG